MNTLVTLNKISVSFGKKEVLKDITFNLNKGEIITLLGPNGAGKTTIIRIILGFLKPTSGLINKKYNIVIGYVPQKIQINKTIPLTVKRFIMLKPKVHYDIILFALKQVDAVHLINQQMQKLSNGEMQRVLLARAILNKPDLILLDEPAQGVDIIGQIALYELIYKLKTKFICSILMISHDLHLVMAKTNKVLCINKHICCSGTPDTIYNHPEFINMFNDNNFKQFGIYRHKHKNKHHF
ncbi:Zinc import ATP-binding protein ZnuC [Candidatus Providencia siddallii]|uniref:Zinc import ATP-binding protein ZnuC n=1 Tax=Candidatus Providencia siddallii TaxID=1715285 RepID=A0A0M6W752_9GAMM|nr:Zinc import ATP-binding protein ZnuC [Candidatus Providencia siddallii]